MGENLKPTLAQTLRALADREIELGIVDGALAVSGNTSAINPKLRAAIDDHRAEITRIARCRTALTVAYAAPAGERAARLAEFRELCDLPEGYSDPSDPFAASALPVQTRPPCPPILGEEVVAGCLEMPMRSSDFEHRDKF